MLRYKLASLAKRPKGAVVQLPVIQPSLSAEAAYLKALRAMLREMAQEVRTSVLPIARQEIVEARKGLSMDADKTTFQRFIASIARLVGAAETMVDRILGLEAKRHTKQFNATARKALGIDLNAVVREEDLADFLRIVGARNAGLIKGLADDVAKRIQTAVTSAVLNGTPARALAAEITRQFGIADRRAQLIARDQISKLTSDLNRQRHQQAGITEYVWRTAADERVRERHRALEGKVYAYGQPTGAEEGLPPGQPIACRCVAQAVVKF